MGRRRLARRQAGIRVLLGDANGLIRVGAGEWVWVRLANAANADPPVLAYLPRAATSLDPATPDDGLLPVAGTGLIAEPFGSAGAARGALRIDASSLPAGTTRTA